MASNNHLGADIFLSQHIDKCQEKILYIVYLPAKWQLLGSQIKA
jgi:hypothetical protein